MVTEEEIKAVLQKHGWYLAMQTRRGQGKKFAYAKRRQGKGSQSRYLGAESKLNRLTEEDLLKRIQ